MSSYRINVAVLDVPDNWQDQSITAFRLPPAPGGADASFVITQDASKGVTAFPAYFEKQADSCSRGLQGYRELRREFFEVNERNVAWLEFQWTKERTTMQLRQIYFDCGFFALICTLTAMPDDMAYHDGEWRRVMASLVFNTPTAAPQFP